MSIQDFYSESERERSEVDQIHRVREYTERRDSWWHSESWLLRFTIVQTLGVDHVCDGPMGCSKTSPETCWSAGMSDSERLHAFHVVMYYSVEWFGFLIHSYTTWARPRFKSRDCEGFVSTIRCHPLRLIRYMWDSRKVELLNDHGRYYYVLLYLSLLLSLNNWIRTSIQNGVYNEPHVETHMCEWTTTNFFKWLLNLIHSCEHQSAGRTMWYQLMDR